MRPLSALALPALVALTACGPMPGYRGPAVRPTEAEGPGEEVPEDPQADEASEPPPDEAPPEAATGRPWSESDEVPEVEPPRVPPRAPALPDVGMPAPASRPSGPPASGNSSGSAPGSSGASAVRVVTLDDDNAYLIDEGRNLCFFRHKTSLTPVDCDRVTGRPPAPQPPAPQPPAQRPLDGDRFGADQIRRFEQAFIAIFCDRVGRISPRSEVHLKAAGLDAKTYEDIEATVAGDDARWISLSTRASAACKSSR